MIVSLSGGLGNQLFQYAFGRSLAHARNEELFFDKSSFDHDPLRHYQLNCFNLNLQFAYPVAPFYDEPDLRYHADIYQAPPATTYRGYWQTEKYFWRDMILREFSRFPGQPNRECMDMAKNIMHRSNSCFVGIRRADYLLPERINYHGVMDLKYYCDALDRVMPESVFIFTDDIPWTLDKLGQYGSIVDVNGPDEKHWDIWLMSLCHHAIVANSTFHWWGAYLGPDMMGTVVAPKQWFVNGIPNEVVPDRWIKI